MVFLRSLFLNWWTKYREYLYLLTLYSCLSHNKWCIKITCSQPFIFWLLLQLYTVAVIMMFHVLSSVFPVCSPHWPFFAFQISVWLGLLFCQNIVEHTHTQFCKLLFFHPFGFSGVILLNYFSLYCDKIHTTHLVTIHIICWPPQM